MKTPSIDNYPLLRESGLDIIQVTPWNIWTLESWIIQAYKQVFNASVWREWVKCARFCGYKTTYEEAPQICPRCSGEIVDFYSDAEVSEAIWNVMKKSYFQILILLSGENVVGFTWWWKDSLTNINTDKLKLPNISTLDTMLFQEGIFDTESWYYQSETWIIPKFRTRWVWREFVSINDDLLRAKSTSIDAIIQRTSRDSAMYNIRKSLWYREVYQYGDTDKRVLFARNNN